MYKLIIVLWGLLSTLVLVNSVIAQPSTTPVYITSKKIAKIKNVVSDFYKYQKMDIDVSSVELANSKGKFSKNLIKVTLNYSDTNLNRKGQKEIIIDRWSKEYQYISEYNLIIIDPKNHRGQMSHLGHGQWLKISNDKVSALVSDIINILNDYN